MVKLDKLKGKMREKAVTYEMGAEKLGVSITTFNKKMNGQSSFMVEEAEKLGRLLDMSNDEKISIFLD